MSKIKLNQIECKHCGYILTSTHVHDYRSHGCKDGVYMMVDGGKEYLRRGWAAGTKPEDNYIERSIYE